MTKEQPSAPDEQMKRMIKLRSKKEQNQFRVTLIFIYFPLIITLVFWFSSKGGNGAQVLTYKYESLSDEPRN
jgi:hypothetical protein